MSGAALERLRSEIEEQPGVVARLLAEHQDRVRSVAQAIHAHEPSTIVLVARGSSDNAAVYGRYLLEVCNRQLTSLAAPSGLTLYGRGPRLERTVVIGVSQSGQGEDVVAYLREARRQGAVTMAIVNDEQSPLAAAAEWTLSCLAGEEYSIPATKSVTAQMTLLAMLSVALAELEPASDIGGPDSELTLDRGRPDSALALDPAGLAALPAALRSALELRPAAAELAQLLAPAGVDSVIGRGFAFPPALEIALKLKETSYVAAEPYSAADFLHGPVALVDPSYSALLVDVGGRSSTSVVEIASAIRERGGQIAVLRAGSSLHTQPHLEEVPALALATPVPEPLAPIVALVLGQLLAVEVALARGLDPASPRGLRKVTSTR